MLTWSDWHTEPRSNRYHYAIRFARKWPVYFIQPDGVGDEVSFEPVPGHNITLVHIAPDYGPSQSARLATALRSRRVARPLVWTYNSFMANAVPRLHPAISVYHATEDYLSPPDVVKITPTDISGFTRAAIDRSDLVVAVSEGLAERYRKLLPHGKPIIVLENGCDFAFWDATRAADYTAPANGAKVALFQGGINGRLDYSLLTRLTELLPEWQFWFCGKSVDGGIDWEHLKQRSNVRDFGLLPSESIADLARQSLVGLIPFKESDLMRRSLPLKAYEYLACGLPVVTIPIDALAPHSDLFETAGTAEGFADAIRRLAPSRNERKALAQRRVAAKATSYDARFNELTKSIDNLLVQSNKLKPPLNVLMLYDDRSTHVGTIAEHLDSFRKYSAHRFHFMPATGYLALADREGARLDFSCYDAILIHYSVRVSIESHLSAGVAAAIIAYRGPKLLFIQDEYDRVETSRDWMARLGIDAVFTNVPLDSIDKIYPAPRFSPIDFIPTLTGYVPEDPSIDGFALPIAERRLRIAYRGRALPHHYGALGQEKYRIGIDVRRLAGERGIPFDIEVDDSKRIYGLDWYRFIGSARATLGTESGANVFDMDGRLAELAERHRDMPFGEFSDRFLRGREGLVRMNQISPKIFEAIRLRTALVLFEGTYSDVVRPHEHYIPLRKDYGNIDDVLARLEDIPFLQELTSRAYRDVIETGAYSYRSFVSGVDAYLSSRAGGRRRATIISAPIMAVYGAEDADLVLRLGPDAALLSDSILGNAILGAGLTREQAAAFGAVTAASAECIAAIGPIEHDALSQKSKWMRFAGHVGRRIWRVLPRGVRSQILRFARELIRGDVAVSSAIIRIGRPFWRLLPGTLRDRIVAKIS